MTTLHARRAAERQIQRRAEAERSRRLAFALWLGGFHCALTAGALALLACLGWLA